MADLQKTIQLVFGGVDRTGGAINSVGKNLRSLEDRVNNVTGPMAGVADSVLKLEAALVAMGAAALTFAAKEAVSFEAALIDLEKVMSEGEGSAMQYSDAFANLSSRFGVDATNIVQSVAEFRQAGYDINDSLTLVEQALLGVNAADLTTQQSSELLIGTLAGFQAPAEEAAHLLDVLNGVSNNAGVSVEQLGEGFKILSPIAKTLGLSFEETAALLTPVVEVTRSGSESANALKTAISNLIKPTKERKELLEEELGIQLEMNGKRRDTKDVLYELLDVTKDLDANEQQRVATMITGAEQMSRFLAIINNFERSQEVLKTALNSAGSTLKEYETRTRSANFALDQLKASFTTTAKIMGLEYIDETKAVTKATTDLMDSFREALQGDNADQLFGALREGLTDLAGRIDIIAENLPEAFEGVDLTGLLDAFGDLGGELSEAFEQVFGDVDLTTVEGLQDALQKIVDGMTGLTNVTNGIIDGLGPLFKLIGEGIEQFDNLDEATKKNVGQLLGLSKTIDSILPVLDGMAGAIESVGTGLTALAGAQGFKALIGNLESVKAVGAGAGKFGLIGLALAGGYGVGTLINEAIINPLEEKFGKSIGSWLYEQFNKDELEKLQKALQGPQGELKNLVRETAELRKVNDDTAEMLSKTKTASEDTQRAWQNYADALVNTANKQESLNDAMGGSDEKLRDTGNALDKVKQEAKENGDALGDVGYETRKLAKYNDDLVLGYDKATGKVNSWSGGIMKTGDAYDDSAEKAQKATQAGEDHLLQMERIDSNERIKRIDAAVSLDISEVEANADKVKALAESIGETFASSTDLTGSLFSQLGEADSFRERWAIQDQIKEENENRDDMLAQQKKLIQAEIDWYKAKTRSLNNGDALIKIEGDGLAPHLEAFMFQLLENIQTRVNSAGEEMLLGLNSTGTLEQN